MFSLITHSICDKFQLINAGTIRMNYPDNKAADENFENLRKQYAEGVHSIRDVCDESMDVKTFLRQTEDHIRKAVTTSEDGLRYFKFPNSIVLACSGSFGKASVSPC